jgi:hypothetical protein
MNHKPRDPTNPIARPEKIARAGVPYNCSAVESVGLEVAVVVIVELGISMLPDPSRVLVGVGMTAAAVVWVKRRIMSIVVSIA